MGFVGIYVRDRDRENHFENRGTPILAHKRENHKRVIRTDDWHSTNTSELRTRSNKTSSIREDAAASRGKGETSEEKNYKVCESTVVNNKIQRHAMRDCMIENGKRKNTAREK
jgi:hypothetical protein